MVSGQVAARRVELFFGEDPGSTSKEPPVRLCTGLAREILLRQFLQCQGCL
jgi:hypothetical protein